MLSVIVMLFIIGLLIAVFSIMGSELKTSVADISKSSVTTETGELLSSNVTSATGVSVAKATLRDFAGVSITSLYANNYSGTYVLLNSGNYTFSTAGVVKFTDASTYNQTQVNVTYTYTYTTDTRSQDIMNDTVTGLAETSNWFDIFIVITAMVVLILLTVIIVTAIRSSGMIAGSGSTGANTVGTA